MRFSSTEVISYWLLVKGTREKLKAGKARKVERGKIGKTRKRGMLEGLSRKHEIKENTKEGLIDGMLRGLEARRLGSRSRTTDNGRGKGEGASTCGGLEEHCVRGEIFNHSMTLLRAGDKE
jgi:hypothetical protein